jgi:hypothetical protein
VTGRLSALAMMGLGAAIAVAPAFAWYALPRAGGEVRSTGFGGAGQLWLLPLLGALAVVAGALLLSARPEARGPVAARAGLVAAVAGLLALAFALWAAAAPRLELTVALGGVEEAVSATADLAPAAVVTPVLAGALALLGLVVAWAGRRR